LAIVFDFVREKIEDEEPSASEKVRVDPSGDPRRKQEYRISDLAGTPWEKKP
jgi:hypothetical protein